VPVGEVAADQVLNTVRGKVPRTGRAA
jgi:hypothetical protein